MSGPTTAMVMAAGTAAIVLVGTDGKVLAAYNWPAQ